MWFMLAQAAMQMTQQIDQTIRQNAALSAQGTINDANTYAQNLIGQTNADAANAIRSATNQFQASQAVLSNLQRSLSNQSKLDTFGKQSDAVATNLARTQDAMTRGSLEQQITNAATLGALRADSVARGVGGTSAAMMRSTMQGTIARQQTQQDEKVKQLSFDALQTQMGLKRAAVNSLDFGQTLAPLDYGISTATLVQSPIMPPGRDLQSAALGAVDWAKMAQVGFSSRTPDARITGGVGDTSNYASNSILNGLNGSGASGYDYGSLGGESNGFFSTGTASANFNFQLS